MTNRVKGFRVMNGDLTQQDLADLVQCSRQTIHSIETGKFVPSVELALKLARALKVKVEDLFQLPSEFSREEIPHKETTEKTTMQKPEASSLRPLKTLTKPWKGGGGNV